MPTYNHNDELCLHRACETGARCKDQTVGPPFNVEEYEPNRRRPDPAVGYFNVVGYKIRTDGRVTVAGFSYRTDVGPGYLMTRTQAREMAHTCRDYLMSRKALMIDRDHSCTSPRQASGCTLRERLELEDATRVETSG